MKIDGSELQRITGHNHDRQDDRYQQLLSKSIIYAR